jgi:DNA-binding beta-propeller fold protein YncE
MIEVANDRNVYVLNAISNSITVYDCLMRKLITEIAVGRCPSIIHYNQRNSMIYVANAADWVNSLVVLKGN